MGYMWFSAIYTSKNIENSHWILCFQQHLYENPTTLFKIKVNKIHDIASSFHHTREFSHILFFSSFQLVYIDLVKLAKKKHLVKPNKNRKGTYFSSSYCYWMIKDLETVFGTEGTTKLRNSKVLMVVHGIGRELLKISLWDTKKSMLLIWTHLIKFKR